MLSSPFVGAVHLYSLPKSGFCKLLLSKPEKNIAAICILINQPTIAWSREFEVRSWMNRLISNPFEIFKWLFNKYDFFSILNWSQAWFSIHLQLSFPATPLEAKSTVTYVPRSNMNMFRDGLNSVSVDNNHHDEILEISDDDSEESSLTSELGDAWCLARKGEYGTYYWKYVCVQVQVHYRCDLILEFLHRLILCHRAELFACTCSLNLPV